MAKKKTVPARRTSAPVPKAAPVAELVQHTPRVIDVAPSTQTALAQLPAGGPYAVLQQALTQNASVDTLERLLGMQERWEAMQAKKAFDAAMAAARPQLPTIMKRSVVDFTSAKGRTHYRHEDLAAVTEAVSPVLAAHGLSFRWKTDDVTKPNKIIVTCILSHALGHSEHTALSAAADDSGNKNDIQQIGSTVTYLQRYTLKAALGLAAAVDDDGHAGRQSAPREPMPDMHNPHDDRVITIGKVVDGVKKPGQLERLWALIRNSKRPETEVRMWLLARYGYEHTHDIKRGDYEAICRAIEAKGPLPVPDGAVDDPREPGQEG